jgi:ubiquinone/menaquinone biosynthesis C-methylase UbiE
MVAVSNDTAIEAWNTVLFDKFTRFKYVLTEGLSGHRDEALGRHLPPEGARVLDVGCGFGDNSIRIANAVAPTGEAVGVDCAKDFVGPAINEARAAGVANASFFGADVQFDELRGPYDYTYACFGTMYFLSPGAALGNIRKSLKPGGGFTQVVWRKREDNPWLYEAEQRDLPSFFDRAQWLRVIRWMRLSELMIDGVKFSMLATYH